MAKTKISEYSSTAADNTDISNINIAEGCSPANLNNAVRSLMAQLKDQQAGTSGDGFTVAGTLTSSGTLAVTGGLTLDGAAGTSGQVMVSAGSGTPTWGAITVSHTHTVTDAGHTHTTGATGTTYVFDGSGGGNRTYPTGNGGSTTGSSTTGITVNSTGSSGTNANLPPYYALCYIMKS